MNPILKYPGAKWRLASFIIEHMPEHESYVEPYFGSGAVFFNKAPARIETINDIDGNVVQFFKTCRDFPDELSNWLMVEKAAVAERGIKRTECLWLNPAAVSKTVIKGGAAG